MTLAQKYMYRAKCSVKPSDLEKVEWAYGNLQVKEICPSPIGNPDDDPNVYYISKRAKNAIADWNLPYPNMICYIPKSQYDTVTPYIGYNDMNGENLFIGDIIRLYQQSVIEDKMLEFDGHITEWGILWENGDFDSCINFPIKDVKDIYDAKQFTSIKLIGNRWDGPRPGFTFADWILWKGKETKGE